MEHWLRRLAAEGAADALTITYDDMHGLWGGVTITVAGGGAYERAERQTGAREPTVTRGALSPHQLRALAALLLELRAWEQRWPIPDRPLIPDESRAALTIRCGAEASRVVEPHDELGAHQRLVRVRDHLNELGGRLDTPTP